MDARVVGLALLSAWCAVGSVVGAESLSDPLAVSDGPSPPRSLSDIQVDVHAALRAEAVTRRQGPNAAEVVRLVELYREMAEHPKRDRSLVLAELGLKVRSRLEKLRDRMGRPASHAGRVAKNDDGRPASANPETRVLAQQIAVPGGAGPGQGARPAAAQPAVATTIDYGPELVELIQQVISPATWDINGGYGSIAYFAPVQALVVSAPEPVHEQIADLLSQLRAAP